MYPVGVLEHLINEITHQDGKERDNAIRNGGVGDMEKRNVGRPDLTVCAAQGYQMA